MRERGMRRIPRHVPTSGRMATRFDPYGGEIPRRRPIPMPVPVIAPQRRPDRVTQMSPVQSDVPSQFFQPYLPFEGNFAPDIVALYDPYIAYHEQLSTADLIDPYGNFYSFEGH